eukprot:6176120-Pleurochrysis_carterae.AAC.1
MDAGSSVVCIVSISSVSVLPSRSHARLLDETILTHVPSVRASRPPSHSARCNCTSTRSEPNPQLRAGGAVPSCLPRPVRRARRRPTWCTATSPRSRLSTRPSSASPSRSSCSKAPSPTTLTKSASSCRRSAFTASCSSGATPRRSPPPASQMHARGASGPP